MPAHLNSKPSVVFITLHDTGRWLGCYGVDIVDSPRIDRLATEGVRCSQMFATSPVCSPSRGSYMTGRHPQSNGLMGLTHAFFNWQLQPGEKHMALWLHEAGYQTSLFCIQHESNHAEDFGYTDIFVDKKPDGSPLSREGAEVADAFSDWLRRRRGDSNPFFAQIGLFETHTPYDFAGAEPDESKGIFCPEHLQQTDRTRRHLAGLQGAVKAADDAVGQILDALERENLARNTIVVFLVDHGVEIPRAKWYCTEAGLGVAQIWRWPEGGVAGDRVWDGLQSGIDVLPTLAELLELPPPAGVEGRSMAAALRGEEGAQGHDYVFGEFQQDDRVQRSVHDGRFHLIFNFAGNRALQFPTDMDHPRSEWHQPGSPWGSAPWVEMYRAGQDPYGINNLARDPSFAEERERLRAVLLKHMRAVDDPLLQGPVATPFFKESMKLLYNNEAPPPLS